MKYNDANFIKNYQCQNSLRKNNMKTINSLSARNFLMKKSLWYFLNNFCTIIINIKQYFIQIVQIAQWIIF